VVNKDEVAKLDTVSDISSASVKPVIKDEPFKEREINTVEVKTDGSEIIKTLPAANPPSPHPAHGEIPVVDASVYRDEIGEVLKEHEYLKNKEQVLVPSDELLMARKEAQRVLADTLRSNLALQRSRQTPKNSSTVFAKVKLDKEHTHNGEVFKPGDVIEVDEPSLRFLEEHKIGSRV
jgi:hypothetical protein